MQHFPRPELLPLPVLVQPVQVTVTVPATGSRYAERLEACFESVWAQQGLPEGSEVEVLLVWQSAEDPPEGVQVVVAQPDPGPFCLARARNIGARHATHDIVAFTDADIVLHPETLARAVARMRATECFVTSLTVMLPERHIAAHGYGGFLLAAREDLVDIGGYDEGYVSWGCLNVEGRVVLADGRRMKIGTIVKKRLPVVVKSLNLETGAIENKRVINWWRQLGPPDQKWKRLVLKHGGRSRQGRRGVVFTPDHKVLTLDGWRRVDELAPGSLVALDDPLLTPRQREMVLGSVLGDASIVSRHEARAEKLGLGPGVSGRAGFVVSHAEPQWEYLGLKTALLECLAGAVVVDSSTAARRPSANVQRKLTSRYTRELGTLRSLCYPTGKKCISRAWMSQVGAFGFAVYYLDDGFLQNPRSPCARLCAYAYGLAGAEIIAERLLELGIGSKIDMYSKWKYTNGEPAVLRLLRSDTDKLMHLIGPFVPPSMRYKVTPDAPPFDPTTWQREADHARPTWVEVECVEDYEPPAGVERRVRYCITVEGNGNFFTPSGLVKNCEDNDCVDRLVWYGLKHVCLTESDGIVVEHQHHPEGTRNRTLLEQNRKRYWASDSILRNRDSEWGALSFPDERVVS